MLWYVSCWLSPRNGEEPLNLHKTKGRINPRAPSGPVLITQVPKDKENILCDMILFSIHSDPENKGWGWGGGGGGGGGGRWLL